MANILNYKYEIFPTAPQRTQLNKILRGTRLQWNKAVTIRKKLKRALIAGQVEHVINTCLSVEKDNRQSSRKSAIEKFQEANPAFSSLSFDVAARLHDIKTLAGNLVAIDTRHLDLSVLTREFKTKHQSELDVRKAAKKRGDKKLPKLAVYWLLMRAINQYAGYAAKTFMDKSFKSPKGMALSDIRFNVSGSANAVRWKQAVDPKKGQRAYGAAGEPQYKRRGEGFTDRVKGSGLIRPKRKQGHLICLRALPEGMRYVNIACHRPLPDGAKVKQLTVNEKSGRFFAVLSAEVPDSAWRIAPMDTGWRARVLPRAQTPQTVALENAQTGETRHLAIHYGFLEKSLDKLEKLQQSLADKHGPRRNRTPGEVQEAMSRFSSKASVRKLPDDEREKAVAKEKGRLELHMVRRQEGASKRWRLLSQKVSALHFRVSNQRADVLHKVSRALAEGCDVVGIGDWEPVRDISYRKQLRAAKKKVKDQIDGAADELKALEEEKSKQGPKGSKKRRRGGRDRAIPTLRRLLIEKAGRAGNAAYPSVKEAGSTYTCCVCGAGTGPRNDTSIRQWECNKCGANHDRDLNSGFNILRKTEKIISAAHADAPATERTATRTTAQGATGQAGQPPGPRAMVHSEKGGSTCNVSAYERPGYWGEDETVPRAVRSLTAMGVARSLWENISESPP